MMKIGIGLITVFALVGLVTTSYADHSWTHGFSIGPGEKGSGHMVTEDRDLAPFEEIRFASSADLIITVGSPQKVSVTFDDNLMDKIVTRVKGKTLIIDTKGSWSSKRDCRIEITVPNLEALTCSGSGHIEVSNLKGDEFSFELSGSGSLEADGAVDQFYVDISGSGDVNARALQAQDVNVDISGSGNAVVNPVKSLDGDISGSGNIRYLGEPERLSSHVSGSGSIRRGK